MTKGTSPAKAANRPISKEVESSTSTRARSICFFNNKGGVGKTTLVANLGAELALNHKKRVLVVDADPQCNLTQYVLNDDAFSEIYGDLNTKGTIFDVIHPLSIGKGYSQNLPIKKTDRFGFDVIIGDPRLALKEDLLAQDWRDAKAGGTRGLRTTFLFSDLISRASANYDYIFFDMGPSLGAINRSILLSADYFVMPMSIDIFSMWAIKNIGSALNVWQSELENGIRLAEDPSELPQNRTTGKRLGFLGYVTQQHKEKTEDKVARTVEAYNTIKLKLPAAVKSGLSDYFPSIDFDPHLGDIKHLASLAPKSQTLHSPMINVTAKGSFTVTRKQAREIYSGLAGKFLTNIEAFAF